MNALSSAGAEAAGAFGRIDLARYNRDPALTPEERDALLVVATVRANRPASVAARLARLTAPIDDVLDALGVAGVHRFSTIACLRHGMHERQRAFWGWTREDWHACALGIARGQGNRHYVLACMYLLGEISDARLAGGFAPRQQLAVSLFGPAAVDDACASVIGEVQRWGWTEHGVVADLPPLVCDLLLAARCGSLRGVTTATVEAVRATITVARTATRLALVARALVQLGFLPHMPTQADTPTPWLGAAALVTDVDPIWAEWALRWHKTSTLQAQTRRSHYYAILRLGRWVREAHPEIQGPDQWTREIAADCVAAVQRRTSGEWAKEPTLPRFTASAGQPLAAKTIAQTLGTARRFFADCMEWGWMPRRWDPARALRTPRTIRAQLGPNPRTIDDDIWAKMLWAGLNLTEADLPRSKGGPPYYPLLMVRAVIITWLFAGLRSDELRRLRVGCVRWERNNMTMRLVGGAPPKDAACLLDVPVNKTSAAFTKPVDHVVGEAIAAWEAARPTQPRLPDPKTGESIAPLFAYRGSMISNYSLNRTLLPLLLEKAGVPAEDARGPITSHRARSTIASQLINADEPLTLLELMHWLGHRQPSSTMHYVRVSATKLTKAYKQAGYYDRNVRAIEVLIDQEAILSGTAAQGTNWKFFDLGHGYCTYDFFEQCPHRMACPKCAFYRPKGSTAAQLLEGKSNLLRLRQEIPLSGDERAAVDEGIAAHERLLATLATVPTPAGPTPEELAAVEHPEQLRSEIDRDN